MFDLVHLVSLLEPVHYAYAVTATAFLLLLSIFVAVQTASAYWRMKYNTRQLVLSVEALDKELKRFEDMLTTTRTLVVAPEVFADAHKKEKASS